MTLVHVPCCGVAVLSATDGVPAGRGSDDAEWGVDLAGRFAFGAGDAFGFDRFAAAVDAYWDVDLRFARNMSRVVVQIAVNSI